MKLSVLVQTATPWPQSRIALDSLLMQLKEREDFELVLTESNVENAQVPDEYLASFLNFQHIKLKNSSIHELRALGLSKAKGNYIAITEDHCKTTKLWLTNIEKHFDKNPNTIVLGGNVLNGKFENCFDRASYWFTFNRYIGTENTEGFLPCIANLAIRRSSVKIGWGNQKSLEQKVINYCKETKLGVYIDNPVYHVQSHGKLSTLIAHFHNGRTCVGLLRKELSITQFLIRLGYILLLPIWLFGTVSKNIIANRKLQKITLFTDFPLIILISIFHSFGEFCGLLLGPGLSPLKIK